MSIQKVTRAKPQTEEVPSGPTGYIVVRRSQPDIHGETQWYVTYSPFSEVPVYLDATTAILQAENDEYIVQIDLPLVEEPRCTCGDRGRCEYCNEHAIFRADRLLDQSEGK